MLKLKTRTLLYIAALLGIHAQSTAIAAPSADGKPLWKARVKEMPSASASTATQPAQTGRLDPVELNAFLENTKRKIKRKWFPPACSPNSITVQFTLNHAGAVSNLKVTNSSGLSMADEAAKKAVLNAQPFSKLPTGADPTEEFRFHFDYRAFEANNSAINLINKPASQPPTQASPATQSQPQAVPHNAAGQVLKSPR